MDEARLAYDDMYAAIAESVAYRRIVHAAFPDLPEWLVPYSATDLDLLEEIAEALRLGPGSRFVDLACGLGGPGIWMAERTGATLVAVDFAGAAVRAAAKLARARNVGHASFVVAEATQTGLASEAFDALMSIDAVQFMEPRAVAVEIARLLRPSGIAAITTVETLVDDLPVATVAKDYRAVFSGAGFAVKVHKEMSASFERENRLFLSIEQHRDALLDEIGKSAIPLLEEARDRLERAKAVPRVRKVFLVVQKE